MTAKAGAEVARRLMSSLEAGPALMVSSHLSISEKRNISLSGTLGLTLEARLARLEYYLQNINISFYCLANHLPVT